MPSRPAFTTHPYFDVDVPTVIGHRGTAGTLPENTLEGFAAALEAGAQILESDVHVTRDGVPVLLHDPSVSRVTEGSGDVAALDWAEVAALDAGHHFDGAEDETPADPAGHRGQGFAIPSLEAAFERFPEARFNLEVKCHDVGAMRTTLDLIARFERADRTLLAAGEDPIMRDLRRELAAHPATPAMGASVGEIVTAVSSALGQGEMPPGVMALQIPAEFGGNRLATPALVDHAHAHGVVVHVWTINDLAEIERLLDIGVDGIVTDHPARMTGWLRDAGRRSA